MHLRCNFRTGYANLRLFDPMRRGKVQRNPSFLSFIALVAAFGGQGLHCLLGSELTHCAISRSRHRIRPNPIWHGFGKVVRSTRRYTVVRLLIFVIFKTSFIVSNAIVSLCSILSPSTHLMSNNVQFVKRCAIGLHCCYRVKSVY